MLSGPLQPTSLMVIRIVRLNSTFVSNEVGFLIYARRDDLKAKLEVEDRPVT